jgi:hypothetical protein
LLALYVFVCTLVIGFHPELNGVFRTEFMLFSVVFVLRHFIVGIKYGMWGALQATRTVQLGRAADNQKVCAFAALRQPDALTCIFVISSLISLYKQNDSKQ